MRFVALFALTFLLLFFACLPTGTAYSAELININTADAALLDTLPGIGPSKAQAIIDYRTQNGPFTNIQDIQNVSGIGPATYADIAPFITVGSTSPTNIPNPTSSTSTPTVETTVSTTTPEVTSSGGGPTEYIPIPTLRIVTGDSRIVSSGADTAFTAVVYDGKGNKRDDALVTWSFGDGMKRTGANVYHSYYNSGEYLAVVRATTSDGGDIFKEIIITVKDASIKISSISERGISVTNNGPRTLDLSLWRLSMGGKEFKIPEDTQILSGRTILFPTQIIQLPASTTASLLFPSGEVADKYPTQVAGAVSVQPVQLSEPLASLNTVKKVEQINSPRTNVQTNEEAVVAPASATELAAAGAALPESNKKSPFSSLFFVGLIGLVSLAGAAFVFIK